MFTLPNLPYSYNALEPFYDAKTVEIHHSKHHQTYTDKLNAAVKAAGAEGKTIEEILTSLESFETSKQTALRNHSGGFWNHTFFWESMTPNTTKETRVANGTLAELITKIFGSFEEFQKAFSAQAGAHFGSGWTWLVVSTSGGLEIIDTHDQVCPLSLGFTPLLVIDVWEHAYYIKHQNRRPEWIADFWNIVDWNKAEERFTQA